MWWIALQERNHAIWKIAEKENKHPNFIFFPLSNLLVVLSTEQNQPEVREQGSTLIPSNKVDLPGVQGSWRRMESGSDGTNGYAKGKKWSNLKIIQKKVIKVGKRNIEMVRQGEDT